MAGECSTLWNSFLTGSNSHRHCHYSYGNQSRRLKTFRPRKHASRELLACSLPSSPAMHLRQWRRVHWPCLSDDAATQWHPWSCHNSAQCDRQCDSRARAQNHRRHDANFDCGASSNHRHRGAGAFGQLHRVGYTRFAYGGTSHASRVAWCLGFSARHAPSYSSPCQL